MSDPLLGESYLGLDRGLEHPNLEYLEHPSQKRPSLGYHLNLILNHKTTMGMQMNLEAE